MARLTELLPVRRWQTALALDYPTAAFCTVWPAVTDIRWNEVFASLVQGPSYLRIELAFELPLEDLRKENPNHPIWYPFKIIISLVGVDTSERAVARCLIIVNPGYKINCKIGDPIVVNDTSVYKLAITNEGPKIISAKVTAELAGNELRKQLVNFQVVPRSHFGLAPHQPQYATLRVSPTGKLKRKRQGHNLSKILFDKKDFQEVFGFKITVAPVNVPPDIHLNSKEEPKTWYYPGREEQTTKG